MVNLSKKAISPVVATALLLVVAVVAVVGFQTWFNTYQSGINTKVETQSNAGSSITIERLENASAPVVYVKNTALSTVTVSDVKVSTGGTGHCDWTAGTSGGTLTVSAATSNSQPSVTALTLDGSNCTTGMTAGQSYSVAVVTNGGVYQETEVLR